MMVTFTGLDGKPVMIDETGIRSALESEKHPGATAIACLVYVQESVKEVTELVVVSRLPTDD